MENLHNHVLSVNGRAMARLFCLDDEVYVKRLPACSIGTHLMLILWLRDLGYKAK